MSANVPWVLVGEGWRKLGPSGLEIPDNVEWRPVDIDDRPALISKAQFRGLVALGFTLCRAVPLPKNEVGE